MSRIGCLCFECDFLQLRISVRERGMDHEIQQIDMHAIRERSTAPDALLRCLQVWPMVDTCEVFDGERRASRPFNVKQNSWRIFKSLRGQRFFIL